jgi:hypothetical protein
MRLNLWISLPLSMICVLANAQGTASTTTTANTTATAKVTPLTTAPAAATSTAKVEAKKETPSVAYSLAYEVAYSLQSEKQPDGSRSQSMGHTFTPGISYGDYSGSLIFEYNQDLLDSANKNVNFWSDPILTAKRKSISLGEYLKLGPSATLVLPFTNKSKNEIGMVYNIGAAASLSLNTKVIGLSDWSLSYQLSANKIFTDFDTNAKTGNPNPSHRLRNRLSFGYSFTESLSFFNLFDFNSNYNVNGTVTNSFFTLQSLGYSITENISASLSHTNGGNYLKSGSYENNLKAYDSENSAYNVGLEVSL